MILFFDTETTGVVGRSMTRESRDHPRIVQIAALLTSDDGTEDIASLYCIVRPDGFHIPEEAARIHGVTTEKALRCGIPILSVLSTFSCMLNTATEVVGHNVDFDVKMVRHELWRLQKPDRFEGKPSFCTMLASKPLLRLPAPAWLKNDFKFPKLEETYEFFFQKKFDDAHDALADIRATRACYFALKNHPSQDEIPFDFPTTQQNQP